MMRPSAVASESSTSLVFDLIVKRGRATFCAKARWESPRVVVRGPSGAGKTTLVRCLLGLERNAVGTIVAGEKQWLDTAADISLPAWRRRCGFVPQEALLFPHLSVEQNLNFAADYIDEEERPSASDVDRIVESLKIEHVLKRASGDLSGGEKQRVAIGRALLSAPRWLLMDEPTSALDDELRRHVLTFIRAEAERLAAPLLVVSHSRIDLDLLEAEVWQVNDGTLSLSGSPNSPRAFA